MVRRLLLLALLATGLLLVSGCGREDVVHEAETEGIWVDAGPLDYHIQGSRQLIPTEVPDDRYLAGVPEDVEPPTIDETWFAVFLRIENKTKADELTAEEFEIEDTEGKIFKPVELDPEINSFAYEPTMLDIGQAVPKADSSQEFDSTAGSLLLFKLPLTTIANRPLEFKIIAPSGEEALVTLDV
jgi:hypothetical protein